MRLREGVAHTVPKNAVHSTAYIEPSLEAPLLFPGRKGGGGWRGVEARFSGVSRENSSSQKGARRPSEQDLCALLLPSERYSKWIRSQGFSSRLSDSIAQQIIHSHRNISQGWIAFRSRASNGSKFQKKSNHFCVAPSPIAFEQY